ncbi:hypothetical protein Leryth_003975 [Lithospermum erythrorhizon]|nr:hypothetical protein Leryth_003975 [Lithospermum erythrorhizon]
MGTLVGHVAPGFAFFVLGFWHLLNHMRLHALNPTSYTSLPWFPTSRIKYLELYLIISASLASISMELIIGPDRHQPFDPDGTIPSNHLQNFEHSNISMAFFVYAIFSILLDKFDPPAKLGLTHLLGAIAFGQQLLIFHLHSADHMGVEGQYHWLLQIVVFVSLLTTLIGICHQKSFLNSFVRSLSILLQGVWFMVMGFMLWTPKLLPKSCFLNLEEGHHVVRCHSEEDLERAKSLVNIQFSWYLIGVIIFGMLLYLVTINKFLGGRKVEYQSISKFEAKMEEDEVDVEAQKKIIRVINGGGESRFLPIEKSFAPMDIER